MSSSPQFPRSFGNVGWGHWRDNNQGNQSNSNRDIIYGQSDGDPYEPTVDDVSLVKILLRRTGKLPIEIVDIIIDHAEYWPHTHTNVTFPDDNGLMVPSRQNRSSDVFLCRTPPLGFTEAPAEDDDAVIIYKTKPTPARPLPNQDPAHPGHDATCLPDTIKKWLPNESSHITEHPCRKIVFTIVSRDQGWASNTPRGTYNASYTWFDVGLERYGRAANEEPVSTPERSQAHGVSNSVPAGVELYSINPKICLTDPEPGQTSQIGEPSYTYVFPPIPDSNVLQANKVAIRDWSTHKIEWSWKDGRRPKGNFGANNLAQDGAQRVGDGTAEEVAEVKETPIDDIGRGSATSDGKFVRNLRIGDVVTVWAKARFPGWINKIRSVDVKVYWTI